MLAGLAGYAVIIGRSRFALLAFGVTTAVIVGLTTGLALLMHWKPEPEMEGLRLHIGDFKRWGGGVLLLTGVWVVILELWPALVPGFLLG